MMIKNFTNSSCLKKAEMDNNTKELTLHFYSGSVITYVNVEKYHFENLCSVLSPGTYYNRYIKSNYLTTESRIYKENQTMPQKETVTNLNMISISSRKVKKMVEMEVEEKIFNVSLTEEQAKRLKDILGQSPKGDILDNLFWELNAII